MTKATVWILGVIFCLAFVPGKAADWQPKQAPLMTKWAKDVSPDKVHPEYPRPQMVREHWQNLNGLWDYAILPKEATLTPDKWDGQILVPFPVESALSGVMKQVGPDKALWYSRSITVPRDKAWEGKQILLHFGAVDWETTVWVNGIKVGEHRGGYDPFSFDITEALFTRKSPTDDIVVRVWDGSDADHQARGKQVSKPGGIFYTPTTGIWQTVWIEPVPRTYIRGVTITPDFDNRQVAIRVDVVNPQPGWKVGVLFNSQPKSGGVFHRLWHSDLSQPIVVGLGRELEDRIPEHLWTPGNPHLIDIHVALVADPKAGLLGFGQEWMPKLTGPGAPEKKPSVEMADWIKTYAALRKISLGKDDKGVTRLMLNNKFVFQYGPLDQGFWPDGLYTAPTDEALKFDIEMTKQYGFNMIRKHVKVEPARWYYHCDKLGMLVWQDMPSGDKFIGPNDPDIQRSPESTAQFEQEWTAIINALRPFPCIVMWVPFNEGWGQFDTARIVDFTRKLDPTRLVDNASGWSDRNVGDVHDIHVYPGPDSPKPTETRAAVLGEFGGLGLPMEGHTWQSKANWGYRSFTDQKSLTEAYVDLVDQIPSLIASGLSAAVYTQTTDVETEVNGLMTYDRAVMKIPLRTGVLTHQELWMTPRRYETLIPTSQKEGQTWKYTFEKPVDGWEKPGFDDSKWKTGLGGFGEKSTPGSVVRTEWKTNDIWIRRTFDFPLIPYGEIRLMMHHDEDVEVYFDGILAKQATSWTMDYRPFRVTKEANNAATKGSGAFNPKLGPHTLAVHCKQTGGGQYIDVGLELGPLRK
jgi:hypothetical protein